MARRVARCEEGAFTHGSTQLQTRNAAYQSGTLNRGVVVQVIYSPQPLIDDHVQYFLYQVPRPFALNPFPEPHTFTPEPSTLNP